MTQYYDDFSGTTPDEGNPPDGWTHLAGDNYDVVTDASSVGGQALERSGAFTGMHGISFDAPGDVAGDVEICDVVEVNTVNGGAYGLLACWDQSTLDGYSIQMLGNGRWRLRSHVSGATTTLDDSTASALAGETWARLLRVDVDEETPANSMVRWKVWKPADPADPRDDEPAAWEDEVANSDHTSGVVGVGADSNSETYSHHMFSVGTGGDSAPSVAPAGPVTVDAGATDLAVFPAATIDVSTDVDLHPTFDLAVMPTVVASITDPPPVTPTPTRPTLAEVVRRTHDIATAVSVVDPSTGETVELEVNSGKVTIDRTRDVRRTIEAELTDPTGELTPASATDLLSPFGNELHVARGVVHDDGTVELVDLGVFRLVDFNVTDGEDGLVIKVEGKDRSVVVQRAKWESTFVVAAGTATEVAIEAILTDRYPGVPVNLPTMGATTPRLAFDGSEGDPWRDAADLAKAAGWDLFFDGPGQAAAERPATPDGEPVAAYADGSQAVLLDVDRSVSTDQEVYNGVIATAENTSLAAPLRSVVWDEDPGSPTYYLGKFKKVPRKWSTPLATSQAQLDQAARSLLDGILGANEDIELRKIVDPTRDVNQVIEITRERAGLDAVRVVLDVVEIPLTAADAMDVSGRRRFL